MANNRLPLKNNKYKNMKLLRLLLPFLSLGIILSACQKDYSAESGTAKGNVVKDAAGDCAPILVNGAYVKDVVLGATNYADVQVNITQLGIYNIKSDTVNGYFFSGTGYAATEGLTTIRLTAIGKPVAAGLNLLTLKFDASTCVINVVVTATGGGGGGTAAVFTLNGSPTACAASTQTTNFFAGLPTTAANKVTVFANVTTAGSYSINTGAAINGLTFSGAGTLAAGTSVQIELIASGTPTAAGATFTYPLAITTVPASNCSFTLTVQAALSPAAFTFNCAGSTANGTYQVGTAMTAANTITLPITVTTPGSYTITTANVNGIVFSGAGVLTASSPSITLAATVGNLPATTGPFLATVTFGTANCLVPIIFTSVPAPTNFIRANINGVTTLTTFNVGALGIDLTGTGNSINIFGDNNASGIENIDFTVLSASALVINTDYTVNQIASGNLIDASYTNSTGVSFSDQSDLLIPQLDRPFTVRFSQISTSPNRVKGTFKGRVDDGGTGFIYFTNGEFDITY
jgi:hypothetical protein